MFSALAYRMILSPKHLPRLAATIGLFTNYGLRDFAKRQRLLNLEGAGLAGGDGESDGDRGDRRSLDGRHNLDQRPKEPEAKGKDLAHSQCSTICRW